ncbi:aerobic C4-dicarboxylate transport protein [Gemmobacter aquatilis]|uniref:C4-dicarboxylate transport protein n=1 Tax=Gemmobacter aquatilis TaxID=933059 RepID=A0A1H7Z4F9_9RHOB|nr:dicarboxylate/amino acid:cation symporter [Gemmobacter aquatilis]SEM53071.1 aerobic C4-dicarboxylate transport protein [Gemmobacter aquatilis]
MHLDHATPALPAPRPFYRHLYFQVILAITIGAFIGHFQPDLGVSLKPLGDGFIKLVKMIISPVIFLTIVTGLAGMGSLKGVGSVLWKSMAYFLTFSTLALIVGLIVANVVQPGAGMNIDVASLDAGKVTEYASKAHATTLTGFVLDVIPTTFTSAFVEGNILQVLFIAIIFGVGLILVGEKARPVITLFEAASHVVFRVVDILMKAAPIGAFGAFAFTIGKYGVGSIINLAALVGTFYLTAAVFIIVILGLVCVANGFSIFRLISYLKAEILLVLGTSSSESALPSLMEKMEKAGCARPVVGLVVPTGYSFNLDGTNIYMTLAALFIAQATNTALSLEQQILLLLVAMLSSKGAAGVTGAGFITLAATLSVVPTVPIAGMAIILGVDRFMSECRSITNFIGNAVATVVVSRWEGALDRTAFNAALNGDAPRAPFAGPGDLHAPAGLQLGEASAD